MINLIFLIMRQKMTVTTAFKKSAKIPIYTSFAVRSVINLPFPIWKAEVGIASNKNVPGNAIKGNFLSFVVEFLGRSNLFIFWRRSVWATTTTKAHPVVTDDGPGVSTGS